MGQPSPTIEGFRAVFRRPGITLAEITWRWSFGAAVLALLTALLFEFLDTLPVSWADRLLLGSRQPFLVSHAVGHILHGSARRAVVSSLIVVAALAIFWILAASFGRVATLRSLVAYFSPDDTEARGGLRSLLALNFLRVALALAAVLALAASGVIAGFASSNSHPNPGMVFLTFTSLALLVGFLWSMLNWFLSVAPLFVLHGGCDVFASVSATMDFCRQRTAPVFWSSTAFTALHAVVFFAATSVVAVPLALAGVAPGWVIVAAVLLLTLIYFAVVDFLYTGRMAAYACILQRPMEEAPVAVSGTTPVAPLAPATQSPGWYRTDDDILSDVPGLSSADKPPDRL